MTAATGVRAAAWVPDADRLDWDAAVSSAVSWTRRECVRQRASGVLVLNAFGAEKEEPSLERFARDYDVTTPRAGRERVGLGCGPVLVYVPNEKTLQFAMRLARGSTIVAIENSGLFPLSGWAAELRAVDLTHPDEQPSPIPDAMAATVDRLELFMNNAFGDKFGKQRTLSILRQAQEAGALDRDILLGAVAARGASARALKNLNTLIDNLEW